MPKSRKISDEAVTIVPALTKRISLFKSKLQIAHYAQGSITDYCHALYKAVVFIGKLPDDFTQEEVDSYFSSMLSRQPIPAEAQFKHFVYGLNPSLIAKIIFNHFQLYKFTKRLIFKSSIFWM